MPLFRCSKCGCVENTALAPSYWMNRGSDKGPECSECETGKWHGRFEKKSASGYLLDQNNHLWTQGQVDANLLPTHYKIVGKVE